MLLLGTKPPLIVNTQSRIVFVCAGLKIADHVRALARDAMEAESTEFMSKLLRNAKGFKEVFDGIFEKVRELPIECACCKFY